MKQTDQITQDQAWALVAYADRINKGLYIKFPEFDQESGNISIRPNREVIREQVLNEMTDVTDADKELGLKMYDHFQGLAFTVIGEELGDYDRKIMNLISRETVSAASSMAFLSPMGARYRREIAREVLNEECMQIGSTSVHQGITGTKVTLKVKVLAKFAGKMFPGSVVKATDGNNFYFWTSSRLVDDWPDTPEEFEITGTVKAHGETREGRPETRLTRVKIVL